MAKTSLEKLRLHTIDYFWDCECEKNYIHPKSVIHCIKCDTYESEQPDSREGEVMDLMIKLYFKDNSFPNPLDHELAIRQSDCTVIDINETEREAYSSGYADGYTKAVQMQKAKEPDTSMKKPKHTYKRNKLHGNDTVVTITTSWCAEDVRSELGDGVEDWSDKKIMDELEDLTDSFIEKSVESGWDVIRYCWCHHDGFDGEE